MKTASPDQDLFDRLLAKKHAEVKATLRAPTVVQEFAQDMGTTVVALRQEVAERLLGMGIDPSDLRSGLIDECIERDLEAQRRAYSMRMGERTRALKNDLTRSQGRTIAKRDIDAMRAKLRELPPGGTYEMKLIDRDEAIALYADPDCPPGSIFGLNREPAERLQGQRVRAATLADMHAIMREIWKDDVIKDFAYSANPMFASANEEPEEVRVPFYADLHCERPGINFVLRLDDDGDDDEIVVRHQHEGATDE